MKLAKVEYPYKIVPFLVSKIDFHTFENQFLHCNFTITKSDIQTFLAVIYEHASAVHELPVFIHEPAF